MKLGTPTVCPVCKHVHPFGARLGTPYDKLRYCSDKCQGLAEQSNQALVDTLSQPGAMEAVHRANRLITVWCNCCVSRYEWSPALDGADCPSCGYRLSLYGPFEPKPSFALPVAPPPPMPLTITRCSHA